MNPTAKIFQEDRRLVILRILTEAPGSSANESILDEILHAVGHRIGRDVVRSELAWLSEQGLVTLEDLRGVMVAVITQRGQDTATGQTIHPGVKRPAP